MLFRRLNFRFEAQDVFGWRCRQGLIAIIYESKVGFSKIYLGDTQISAIQLGTLTAACHGDTKIFETS